MNKINTQIVQTLQSLRSFKKGTQGGHKLEDVLAQQLEANLKKHKFKLINAKTFKDFYPEYKEHCSTDFDFSKVQLDSGIQDDNLIIEQPLGSQNTPDILIIHNKVGLPIECKTSSNDKITWNSGYPRENYIYLFNKYNGINAGTTYFLGQDSILPSVRNELLKQDQIHKQQAKDFNKTLKENYNTEWSLYPRPMFTSSTKYFNNSNIKNNREKNVEEYILKYIWSI